MKSLREAIPRVLAKRPRAAGHSTYYAREETGIPDGPPTREALEEGRVLLTSDGGSPEHKPVGGKGVFLRVVPRLPLEDRLPPLDSGLSRTSLRVRA